jgi:hypothetical protein
MALGILLILTIYSIVGMILAWTVKVEQEWDSQ